ncbi:MAG: hypothetical protein J5I93_01115 [Pirellulaceae bacterium]|nr:hypothetical protein [Pirellulaceae bacterium]
MDARNYADWCDVSGLYLANVSHYDRYRTYARQLSEAGLNTVIVWEFLRDNQGELNVDDWRGYAVYETGGSLGKRIEMTTRALRAIGAVRIAREVETSESKSPFDAFLNLDVSDPDSIRQAMQDMNPMDMLKHLRESAFRMMPELAAEAGAVPVPQSDPEAANEAASREARVEVERLLDEYVASHQPELLGDLERHGDPRVRPGYTREGRLLELLKRNKPRGESELISEMRDVLPMATAFVEEFSQVFQRTPTDDKGLNQQFGAIGQYEVKVDDETTDVSWDAPAELTCPWKQFSLLVSFPTGELDAVSAALQAVAHLRQRLPELADVPVRSDSAVARIDAPMGNGGSSPIRLEHGQEEAQIRG